MRTGTELLSVHRLTTIFESGSSALHAVQDVSFSVKAGRITALVGESGSGKSVTALSVMGLVAPPGRIMAGKIVLNGQELPKDAGGGSKARLGRDMSMIFQDPAQSLNPVMSVGNHLIETIRRHRRVSKREARRLAVVRLQQAGLPDAESLLYKYAFELSGGMCQRIMIALALASEAKLLIADEPTTALDVSVQAEVLHELYRISRQEGVGILLITHDLGVVAEIADDVYVMQAGRIVEYAPVVSLFDFPRHPYTKQLLDSRF
ncbi:nickel import ATP-binding protein NikD [Saccharibacillus sp. O23]|uniref:ABC transporter ATP-binding protein n=1 Tax=Saccharibacillus sp. O23 TaxID=2009338 RepID=UPI000B4E5EC7|nr:ABC transporter ATP-binding protein [Saccharibacillus sp. O23]OWR30018.1 nickel import ATP-binding protein NikD [Saccharibacillus sp. O23]